MESKDEKDERESENGYLNAILKCVYSVALSSVASLGDVAAVAADVDVDVVAA